jgi:hypothetical protein
MNMKSKTVLYSIVCKDQLDAPTEESGVLYADDTQWAFVHELAYTLSVLNPSRLVLVVSYAYTQDGMIDTAYLTGEEIGVDDCGTYFKFDEDGAQCVLKDGPNGLYWEYGNN